MWYIGIEVRNSPIEGKGVFAKDAAKRGTLLSAFEIDLTCPESEYEERQPDPTFEISAVRWIGETFLYKDVVEDDEYINHSYEPNMLYHSGTLYAIKDIKPGDELTVDYRYFLPKGYHSVFDDRSTGKPVVGYSADEAQIRSTRTLLQLLEEVHGKNAYSEDEIKFDKTA